MPKGILSMVVDEEVSAADAMGCECDTECMDCDNPCFCFTGGSGGGGDE